MHRFTRLARQAGLTRALALQVLLRGPTRSSLRPACAIAASSRLREGVEAPQPVSTTTAGTSSQGSALPKLPKKPGYPAPLVVEEDMQRYITPLYECGWYITDAEPYACAVGQEQRTHTPTALARPFAFANKADEIAFVAELKKLSEKERHHPDVLFQQGGVIVRIHTHQATMPAALEGKISGVQTRAGDVCRGISLYDVRLALLFEGLWRSWVSEGRGKPGFVAQMAIRRWRPLAAVRMHQPII